MWEKILLHHHHSRYYWFCHFNSLSLSSLSLSQHFVSFSSSLPHLSAFTSCVCAGSKQLKRSSEAQEHRNKNDKEWKSRHVARDSNSMEKKVARFKYEIYVANREICSWCFYGWSWGRFVGGFFPLFLSFMLHELLGTFRLNFFFFSTLAAKKRSAHFQRRSGSMNENLFWIIFPSIWRAMVLRHGCRGRPTTSDNTLVQASLVRAQPS